jgi:hypothetical protein
VAKRLGHGTRLRRGSSCGHHRRYIWTTRCRGCVCACICVFGTLGRDVGALPLLRDFGKLFAQLACQVSRRPRDLAGRRRMCVVVDDHLARGLSIRVLRLPVLYTRQSRLLASLNPTLLRAAERPHVVRCRRLQRHLEGALLKFVAEKWPCNRPAGRIKHRPRSKTKQNRAWTR